MTELREIYPLTAGRDSAGRLSVDGLAVSDLAAQYGTPLYVYDGTTVQSELKTLRDLLDSHYPGESEITYASKAYFAAEFARRIAAMGAGVDVVSLGEIKMARRAGFSAGRVHLHGNNKSEGELRAAMEWGVQAIVVDSLEELAFLETLASAAGKKPRVWLRITPGVSVDTHPYRQTAHASSKFGLPLMDGQAEEGIRRAMNSPALNLTGLHMHLGSQIFETEPYERAIALLYELAERCGFTPQELSPGGGWGVPYTEADEDPGPLAWIATVSRATVEACRVRGWSLPRLIVEPGRRLTARAGLAVYRVGTSKTTADGQALIAVDGGMADNPRPALYHAHYTACLADRPDAPAVQTLRVVGKFCESGDELIPAVRLPEVQRGDCLVIPCAGAYQLSMASNYNLAPRPAVLWVENGQVEVLQHREEADESDWWQGG